MMNELTTNTTVTMTSIELVEFINSQRGEGDAVLRHDSFMAKVPKVLGDSAPEFIGTQRYGNNNTREIYTFPKREACLMAMSYSYDIQAKVFDRMTQAEEQLAKQQGSAPSVKDPRTAALIESLVRLDAFEQEQNRQAVALARVQEDVAVIEARTQPENKHFTVTGFATMMGKPIDIKAAARMGRRCAMFSKEQGLPIGDIRDPRFGYVHTYHESVLQAVFDCQAGGLTS